MSQIFKTMSFLAFVLSFAQNSDASSRFDRTRMDATVPAACVDLDVQNFDPNYRTVIYGISGAKAKGFTDEFPLKRQEAAALADLFKGRAAGRPIAAAEAFVARNTQLAPVVAAVESTYRQMGFDFKKEGDILEILSLLALSKVFNPQEYFFTGGYAYHAVNNRQVLGELDILVGRRSDCKIVVVGEAKLGLGAINHAKQQLARFRDFLFSYIGRARGFTQGSFGGGPVQYDNMRRPFNQFGPLADIDEDVYGRPVYYFMPTLR